MAYRSDIDALEARLAALEGEVTDRTRERDEVARLLDEARGRAAMSGMAEDWAAGGPMLRRRRRARLAIGLGLAASLVMTLAIVRGAYRAPDHTAQVMAQFERYTDEMCACHDKVCAQEVADRMTAWGTEQAKQDPSPQPFDDETMKHATELGERMGKCMSTAMMVESPAMMPQ